MSGHQGWYVVCTVAVTGEHARVLGRPPHCGLRRPRKMTVRTVTTDCVQQRQPQQSTERGSRTCTPTTSLSAASPDSTSRCVVDEHLPVNLLNIRDRSLASSAESSSSSGRKRESPPSDADGRSLPRDDVPVSRRRAVASLDKVDLWEDTGDSQLMVLTAASTVHRGPLTTTTATQTSMTIADDDDDVRHAAKRAKERRRWNRRHNQHHISCRLSQQTCRPTTSAADARRASDWRCTLSTQAAPASAAACTSRGLMPSIIESSGRPATANKSAADLSHGSVELYQRPAGAGLDLFIRGMKMRLLGNGDERPTTSVTEAKVMCLNDVTSQQRHSAVDILHLTSRLSCSALRFH